MVLPRLYAILDPALFSDLEAVFGAAGDLVAAGCTLIQYRNKSGNARVMLEQARELRKRLQSLDSQFSQNRREVGAPSSERDTQRQNPNPLAKSATRIGQSSIRLIMNDRADLCLAAECDGVHVGQDDLSAESVRRIIGPDRLLGVSTHNPEQLREADLTSANYLAIGPVFATSSKQNPDPVVGLEGVRRAQALTRKPLVAIGGITRANAVSVVDAGADAVAVISDLMPDPRKSAEEFLRILR